MDRGRLIREITAKGILVEDGMLKVVKELGRGGNRVAFRCVDSHGNFVVAKIYIPPDNRDLDERSLARFEREIKLSTTLRHPNVIRALASGTLKIGAYTLPFYTMPLAPKTLRDVMKPWADADSLDRLLRLFLKAARGVVFLHSNEVVHRDLKPENVLIADDGTPWIADLGIAHVNPQFVSGSLKTIEKERLLNRDYYAPEQRFGSAVDVDQRADIYALGCILYELVLGTPPVRNNSPALNSKDEALGYLDPVFNRMTAYAVDDRYQRLDYGNTQKASSFRPSSDKASAAISRYPADLRLKVCGDINQPVRPWQVLEIINGLPTDKAYVAVSKLAERKLLLLDWTETEVELLTQLDADRAWPQVEELFKEGDGFKLRTLLGHLTVPRKIHCIKLWLDNLEYSWYFEDILKATERLETDVATKKELLKLILSKVNSFPGSFKAGDTIIKSAKSELRDLSSESAQAAQAGGPS